MSDEQDIEQTDQSAIVEALRRANRELWREIETHQTFERERPLRRAADEPRPANSPTPAASAKHVTLTHDRQTRQRLVNALSGAISATVYERCRQLATSLATEMTLRIQLDEQRRRGEQSDIHTALSGRLDRISNELSHLREELDELGLAHGAPQHGPLIIEHPFDESSSEHC